jgi:hypothetical protein
MTLYYPASRNIRHQTLVSCVTAAGDAYCPLLVSSDPAARAVFEHQIRDGIDFQIEISLSPYVNAEIFQRYVDTVLIPAVEANRQLPGCDKKLAILFCDNSSAHVSNSMLEKLVRHGVLVLTYLSHTSHIFQVLEVLSSGLVKRSKIIKFVMIHCPYMSITFLGFLEYMKPQRQAQQYGQHGGRQDSSIKTGT